MTDLNTSFGFLWQYLGGCPPRRIAITSSVVQKPAVGRSKIFKTIFKQGLCAKLFFAAILINISLHAQETNISVHDPVMAKEKDRYYIFCTGPGVSEWSSADMKHWTKMSPVFASTPQWTLDALPGFKGFMWAPDIHFYNNKYYLYYAISAFGKNTSAIGLVTNETLDSSSPKYKWVDHGKIIQSYPGVTNWNAIDPNFVTDDKGKPWLVFGSFWDGLKLIKLKDDGMSVAEDPATIPTVATRKKNTSADNPPAIDDNPKDAGGNAIEAPFIFKKNGYYYLFASIDYCCKGVKSTYKMIVGRSKNVQGPYLDKEGMSMANGGGSLLLQGDSSWYGVGHNGAYTFDGVDYLVYHGYDAADNGKSKLQIKKINWDANKWPLIETKN